MGVESLTGNIEEQLKYYRPSEETAEVLRRTVMVPIIGPFAVGKTVCIQESVKADGDFGYVQGFTTRERRVDEDPEAYRFRPYEEETLKDILRSIDYGELVQAAIHPSTGHIYGSEPRDYTKPYSMLDTLSNTMEGLQKLPFKKIKPVGLVVAKQAWWNRLRERSKVTPRPEVLKRFSEAISSLEWLLAQDEDFPLVNTAAPREDVCQEVIGIVRGNIEPNPRNRDVGEALLNSIRLRTA